ncbi:MAG: REP-associated tyrosine transposase [Armatimonadota bacterium]
MSFHDMNDKQHQRDHVRRLSEVFLEPAIFLITICVRRRKNLFATGELAQMIVETLGEIAEDCQWQIGQYVVMPDHIHFFCRTDEDHHTLSRFIGTFKSITTRRAWNHGISGRIWQREFHDHLLRTAEAYQEKIEYVRRNPVRAGLCEDADDYLLSGKFHDL